MITSNARFTAAFFTLDPAVRAVSWEEKPDIHMK
jgi:hypothetical protein